MNEWTDLTPAGQTLPEEVERGNIFYNTECIGNLYL